jgi:hypothetical protein
VDATATRGKHHMRLLPRQLASVCTLLFLSANQANAAFIEAVHTVGQFGSTTPVTDFSINGPAPVLYLDLSEPYVGGGWEWLGARWFSSTSPTMRLEVEPLNSGTDQIWYQPSASEWNAIKQFGDWRIDTYIAGIDLILIYGVGVGVEVETPGPSTPFRVTAVAPVPLPGSILFLGTGAAALASLRRFRRRNQASK